MSIGESTCDRDGRNSYNYCLCPAKAGRVQTAHIALPLPCSKAERATEKLWRATDARRSRKRSEPGVTTGTPSASPEIRCKHWFNFSCAQLYFDNRDERAFLLSPNGEQWRRNLAIAGQPRSSDGLLGNAFGGFGVLLPLRLTFTDFTKRDSLEIERSPLVPSILRRHGPSYCRAN